MEDSDYEDSLNECSGFTLNQLLHDVPPNLTRPHLAKLKDRCRNVIESSELGVVDICDAMGLEQDDPRWREFVQELVNVENYFLASAILLDLRCEEETRELVCRFGLGYLIEIAVLGGTAVFDC